MEWIRQRLDKFKEPFGKGKKGYGEGAAQKGMTMKGIRDTCY